MNTIFDPRSGLVYQGLVNKFSKVFPELFKSVKIFKHASPTLKKEYMTLVLELVICKNCKTEVFTYAGSPKSGKQKFLCIGCGVTKTFPSDEKQFFYWKEANLKN